MDIETAQIWATYIAIFSFIVGFTFNIINLKKILKDNEPQLYFDLRKNRQALFLTIKNTGKTKATGIRINIKKIHNNGTNNLKEDFIFNIPFELSSNEQIQGVVADFGGNFDTNVFPYLDVDISYFTSHKKKMITYERQIFYNPQTVSEYDSLSDNLYYISQEITKLRSVILRLSNYFDGHSIAPFDTIDIMPECSFQNDLYDALNNKKKKVITRRDIVEKK